MAKVISPILFEAKLCRPSEGGDWLFVRLPQEASDQVPTRSMFSVEGTVNSYPIAGILEPDNNGGHWLRVERAWQESAGLECGDVVQFKLSAARVEPEPDVPEDLREALSRTPAAMAVWTDTTPIARRDWITWMTQGKLAETRVIRLNKMMDMLSKGKRRVCCFDRSGMASKAFYCPESAE